MNIKARVNISHIDSVEHHDDFQDGVFELVERPLGTYMVQIILDDMCAAAILDKESFESALMEDAGMECIGTSGGVNFYGPKDRPQSLYFDTMTKDQQNQMLNALGNDTLRIVRCSECNSEIAFGKQTVFSIDCDCGHEITFEDCMNYVETFKAKIK